ncbi:MAG: hypothetical protein RLZZ298_2319 [Pseudomonadota bacterium]|jgi:hypothetical protein
MSQAAQLAQRVIVLHREPGYLRLQLPAELCTPEASAAIEQGMAGMAGISVAAVDRDWQRISIRFEQMVCTTAQVARQLFALLDNLPTPNAAPEPLITEAAGNGLQPLLDKFRAMLTPAVEAPAGSLQAKIQPILASALTEKAITNFLNDLVAFYLIKAHWDLITKRWLQQPLAYSNAWMTTFYLVFLLVRYRKTHLAK